jgi:hypothetical protein
MKKKPKIPVKITVLLIALGMVLLIYPVLCREKPSGLHLITTQAKTANHTGLIVVTHGWFENGQRWPEDMATAISEHIDPNVWICGYFDWSKGAMTINPADAVEYAKNIAGAAMTAQILKLDADPEHIHLIGHSSGCWTISEAAKILAKQTKADIHLTFFDAYIPKSSSADQLADVNTAADVNFWTDNYYTRDFTNEVTAQDLIHAHNVDVTEVDQLIKDHNFPWKWYYATVTGTFPRHSLMDDKKLITDVNGIVYGFARSCEADPNAWQASLKLQTGNKAVKIKTVHTQ